jgi:hypothetical protein
MRRRGRITSIDYARPHRPLAMRIVNAAAERLEDAGLSLADLTVESILEAARRRTGLTRFGDPSFRRPLHVLLDSIEAEAGLHPVGRVMARQNLIRILANRLRIEDAVEGDPGILARAPRDPVLVTGLQRTGTTLLHRLVSTDPAFRFLASWEAVNPAPWPGSDGARRDPRIRAARHAQASVHYLAPDFFAIHPVEAEEPEEDVLLLEYSLMSTVPEATLRVPTYSRWMEEEADHVEAYRYLGRVLALLSGQGPGGRWILKSPHHLENLEAFLEVFPDARVVQTHRDPSVALASFCSMMAHARGIFTDDVDPVDVGRHWSRKQVRMVTRAMEARERLGDGRFLDVLYADLVRDPVAEVGRVYGFLGLDLAPGQAARMRAYVRDNPRHRHGRHRYALDHFGLEPAAVGHAFDAYVRRHSVPSEPGGG